MNLNQVFYINGIKVETDPLGIKVFTKDKEKSDLINKYYRDEFSIYLKQ